MLTLIPTVALPAKGASYTTADWNALRNNWKVSICGDDTIDWDDPEIQKIVGVTNSSGVSSSGISYNGGRYWKDLENNRSNSGRIFGSTNITITVASDTMRKQFVYLMYMAKAYGTRGAVYYSKDSSGKVVGQALYQNQALRDAIFYGLEKGTSFYNRISGPLRSPAVPPAAIITGGTGPSAHPMKFCRSFWSCIPTRPLRKRTPLRRSLPPVGI